MSERPPPTAPVTIRAIFLGLALIPPNILWIVWIERFRAIAYSTTASLFFTAIFSLLFVMGLNAPLKRFAPTRALQQGELLTVYSLLSLGTAMAGVDFVSPLITVIAHGFRAGLPFFFGVILADMALGALWTLLGLLLDIPVYSVWSG